MRSFLRIAGIAALVVSSVPGLCHAATMEVAEPAVPPPQPQPQSTAETGWNPQVRCVVGERQGIYDLLRCLAEGIDPNFPCPGGGGYSPSQTPPPYNHSTHIAPIDPPPTNCEHARSDYNVWFLPGPQVGIQIHRLDGGEVNSLFLRENDPNITYTAIEVDRPGMIARIGRFEGAPTGRNRVSVWVNDREIDVDTRERSSGDDVTRDLAARLPLYGFSVILEPAYIVITGDHEAGTGITKIRLVSTDSGMVKSEIRIDPPGSMALAPVGETNGEAPQ